MIAIGTYIGYIQVYILGSGANRVYAFRASFRWKAMSVSNNCYYFYVHREKYRSN